MATSSRGPSTRQKPSYRNPQMGTNTYESPEIPAGQHHNQFSGSSGNKNSNGSGYNGQSSGSYFLQTLDEAILFTNEIAGLQDILSCSTIQELAAKWNSTYFISIWNVLLGLLYDLLTRFTRMTVVEFLY